MGTDPQHHGGEETGTLGLLPPRYCFSAAMGQEEEVGEAELSSLP